MQNPTSVIPNSYRIPIEEVAEVEETMKKGKRGQ
jgi:hypothetical protein